MAMPLPKFSAKLEVLELRSRPENYGESLPAIAFSRQRVARMRRPERKGLQHGKCDAETHDQRRGADRQHGKSPLGMFFDIRVHVCLRGKAGFVPKARTQTRSDQRQFCFYFSSASRVSTCPQRRHSKVCLAAGFEVAIMDIPHFGHGGRRGSFAMREG
jgi:hypothetical protein